MFKHILVPVDFSPDNAHALAIAASIARLAHGEVALLHVIETLADTDFEEFKPFYQALLAKAEQEMAALSKTCPPDVTVTSHILFGKRVPEILRFAQDEGVDLIVMSSHRIDPANPSEGWGTISHKVGLLAACPVMLVK